MEGGLKRFSDPQRFPGSVRTFLCPSRDVIEGRVGREFDGISHLSVCGHPLTEHGHAEAEVDVDVVVDPDIVLSGAFPVKPSRVLHEATLEGQRHRKHKCARFRQVESFAYKSAEGDIPKKPDFLNTLPVISCGHCHSPQ